MGLGCFMFPQIYNTHNPAFKSISLQDFIDDKVVNYLGEYLAMSINCFEGYMHFTITTTNNEKLTYKAMISKVCLPNLDSLVFVLQTENNTHQ